MSPIRQEISLLSCVLYRTLSRKRAHQSTATHTRVGMTSFNSKLRLHCR